MDRFSRRVYFSVASALVFLWMGMVAWILTEIPSGSAPSASSQTDGTLPLIQDPPPSLTVPGLRFKNVRAVRGDTYSSLAAQFSVSERALRVLNRAGARSEPKAGAELVIPSKDGQFHWVEPGQGLSDVAKIYGVPLREVLRANRKRGDSELHTGEILYLPQNRTAPPGEPRAAAMEPEGIRSGFQKPTTGRFADGFGFRIHPLTGKRAFHAGLDLAPGWGTRVMAAQTGRVVYAGIRAGFGRLIILDHGAGLTSWYAHLDEILVKIQKEVKKGDLIGKVGKTGRVTGPHLHFEVRLNDKPQNPLLYLVH